MRNIGIWPLVTLLTVLAGCSEEHSEESLVPGPKGEPPEMLANFNFYSKTFTATESNYVKSLGEIHAFLTDNGFEPTYRHCFQQVLDIRARNDKKNFPCVALQAEKGVPMKAYLTYSVEDVLFNQLDKNNRIIYTVRIYGLKDIAEAFSSEVEPNIIKLSAKGVPLQSGAPLKSEGSSASAGRP